MKPKLKKATYKDEQKITRLLLRIGRPLVEGITANLGIRAFKRSNPSATAAEIREHKRLAWKGVADERDSKVQNAKLRKPGSGSRKARQPESSSR